LRQGHPPTIHVLQQQLRSNNFIARHGSEGKVSGYLTASSKLHP